MCNGNVLQYGITNCDTSTTCLVDYTIQVPVTTFLKVAFGTRENLGGYGTVSEVTPQTT